MIRGLVDFALNNRFLVLAVAVLLFVWGVISFHNLPIEAYPDVANNYVQVITQWPGRAAEEVEQQVTIPLEIVMNGIPHLEHLRSISYLRPVERDADLRRPIGERWNRQKVLERLVASSHLPAGLQPQMGTDWSPVGQIYWYTLPQHQSRVRPDGAEVAAGLGAREAVQVRSECGGCLQLRRDHARVPGARRSRTS